jgi:hypothetical protein
MFTPHTNQFYGDQIRALGVDFVALGTITEGEQVLADPRLWHPSKAFSCIAELVMIPNLRRLYRLIEELGDSRTVVVASGICLGARVAQEALRIPLATVHLQPAALRSYHDTGAIGRLWVGPNVPHVLKHALFWAADRFIIDRELVQELNAFRRELGLAPVLHDYFRESVEACRLAGLYAMWFIQAESARCRKQFKQAYRISWCPMPTINPTMRRVLSALALASASIRKGTAPKQWWLRSWTKCFLIPASPNAVDAFRHASIRRLPSITHAD